jgi:hypothetical protein
MDAVKEAEETIALIKTLVKEIPEEEVSPSEALFWMFKALRHYTI